MTPVGYHVRAYQVTKVSNRTNPCDSADTGAFGRMASNTPVTFQLHHHRDSIFPERPNIYADPFASDCTVSCTLPHDPTPGATPPYHSRNCGLGTLEQKSPNNRPLGTCAFGLFQLLDVIRCARCLLSAGLRNSTTSCQWSCKPLRLQQLLFF